MLGILDVADGSCVGKLRREKDYGQVRGLINVPQFQIERITVLQVLLLVYFNQNIRNVEAKIACAWSFLLRKKKLLLFLPVSFPLTALTVGLVFPTRLEVYHSSKNV